MVLMIDNYDSFTYNVVQYCRELGADLKVIRNDELTIDEIKVWYLSWASEYCSGFWWRSDTC